MKEHLDDPVLRLFNAAELRIAAEFLTNCLPFLSKGLCNRCIQTLADRKEGEKQCKCLCCCYRKKSVFFLSNKRSVKNFKTYCHLLHILQISVILHNIPDVLVAGTDTISTLLEWAMAELLRNPDSMKKLQNELREVLNGKLDIDEDDLKKMKFLKAIIKETIRFHPPGALIGRAARQDVKLMGYDIDEGTMVIINNWGIANDPKLWEQADEFRPERFLDSLIDYKGHDFELTPFGAGRRQCPGISYSEALVEYVLANLIYRFNWELPMGVKCENLDMTERPGSVILQRRSVLEAIATPI